MAEFFRNSAIVIIRKICLETGTDGNYESKKNEKSKEIHTYLYNDVARSGVFIHQQLYASSGTGYSF